MILSDIRVFGLYRGVVWEYPTVRGDHPDSFALLQSKLEVAMPFCTEQQLDYGGYHPHLTLSKYNTVEASAAAITEKILDTIKV